MASLQLMANKISSIKRPVMTLVRGDTRTHIINFKVPRYQGGVDLSGLSWDVAFIDPLGQTDMHPIQVTDIDEEYIYTRWLIHGTVTVQKGQTTFQLQGRGTDGSHDMLWQSGQRYIQITEDINAEPSGTVQQKSELNLLIQKLSKVIPELKQEVEQTIVKTTQLHDKVVEQQNILDEKINQYEQDIQHIRNSVAEIRSIENDIANSVQKVEIVSDNVLNTQKRIDDAENRISGIRNDVYDIQQSALASEREAAKSAASAKLSSEMADTTLQSVQGKVEQINLAVTEAQRHSSIATSSADEAIRQATLTEQRMNSASQYATAAHQSQVDANDSNMAAAQKASEASQSARIARQSYEAITQYELTSSQNAQIAKTSAQQAQVSARRAEANAQATQTNAAIARTSAANAADIQDDVTAKYRAVETIANRIEQINEQIQQIDKPANEGTPGQVLTKTQTGMQWQDSSGNEQQYEELAGRVQALEQNPKLTKDSVINALGYTPVDEDNVGSLDDLETDSKGNLVQAINEAAKSGGGDIIQDPDNPHRGIVTVGTSASIDKTLKLSDYAADSKVVGDRIYELKTTVDQLNDNQIKVDHDSIEEVEFVEVSDLEPIENAIANLERDALKSVTKDAVDSALGVDVVDEISKLEENIAHKLTEPANAQIGQFFRVASIDADGHYVMEAVDAPIGGVSDVKANGVSVVTDGVAVMPIATANQVLGLMRTNTLYGISAFGNGYIGINNTSNDAINKRQNNMPVTTSKINDTLIAGLTDANHITLTAEQQQTAQEVLGINKQWVLKGTLTTENKASGVTVDLTGCTEMVFLCRNIELTSTINVRANGLSLFYKSGSNAAKKYFVHVKDEVYGYSVNGKFGTSNDDVCASLLDGYNRLDGTKVSSITRLTFADSNNVTSCDIEIYAR